MLIGPAWLNEMNGRSTLPEDDFVRIELELALRARAAGQEVLVLPVLIGGATLSTLADLAPSLHDGLRDLFALQAHRLDEPHRVWLRQFEDLCQLIASAPGGPKR